MEHTDIIKRIRERLNDLSEAHRLLADYLVSNYERAVFLTAYQLGQRVGVSESTVVRFAAALGYEGYPQFQRALQELLRTRLTTIDRLRGASESLEEHQTIFHKVMTVDIEDIRTTLQELNPETFAAAVDALVQARRIYVAGFRSAFSLAYLMGYGLNWVLRNVTVVGQSPADVPDQVLTAGPGDAVVAISFPRYSRATVDVLALARRQRARTLAITDSIVSPLAAHADLLLLARSNQLSYYDSFSAPLSLINALMAAVAVRDQARTMQALDELERVWEAYGVYAFPRRKQKGSE
ncbi:MAG: MurR/RpiR family transcriptional regulator [Bacillota bacterium]